MYTGKPVLGIEDGRVVARFETLEDGRDTELLWAAVFFSCMQLLGTTATAALLLAGDFFSVLVWFNKAAHNGKSQSRLLGILGHRPVALHLSMPRIDADTTRGRSWDQCPSVDAKSVAFMMSLVLRSARDEHVGATIMARTCPESAARARDGRARRLVARAAHTAGQEGDSSAMAALTILDSWAVVSSHAFSAQSKG